jgi:hypothetical protein
MANFNFTSGGYVPPTGGNIHLSGEVTGSSTNFDFTETGYDPSNYDLNFGYLIATLQILAGESKDFTSIWADPTANIETAKMYVGSRGIGAALSVVNLATGKLIDSYLIDKAGEYEELLESEDVIDINVSTAGA